jgi:hypothetical protein
MVVRGQEWASIFWGVFTFYSLLQCCPLIRDGKLNGYQKRRNAVEPWNQNNFLVAFEARNRREKGLSLITIHPGPLLDEMFQKLGQNGPWTCHSVLRCSSTGFYCPVCGPDGRTPGGQVVRSASNARLMRAWGSDSWKEWERGKNFVRR